MHSGTKYTTSEANIIYINKKSNAIPVKYVLATNMTIKLFGSIQAAAKHMTVVHCSLSPLKTSGIPPSTPGGGLPYETDGDTRRLA